MNIGAMSPRPARAGARRGMARTIATAVLLTATCGAGHLATTADPARAGAGGTPGILSSGARAQWLSSSHAAARNVWAEATRAASLEPLITTIHAASAKPVDCRRAKCVALTFDDGPGRYTDALLRHLSAYRARATFFVVGQNVAANPSVVRRAYAAGHEIGSHTWSHPDLTKLSVAGIRAQFARTDQAIKAATGVRPKLVRPPYGALNATVRLQTTRPMVLWSVDTLDWRHRDSAKVARKAIKSVRPGSVILFHDIHPTTVAAMPKVLKSLSRRGYKFVTVSRLFGGRPPRIVYSGGPLGLT
ncbi:polysaccharide deacetylase family protein [Nonomuraea sp. KM90]|uniref:polysaccharide deacetylase family protein n=1 Tax=Nonomuraea sp. KM90 TaxID=3457428 RepID=UPI003FCD8094